MYRHDPTNTRATKKRNQCVTQLIMTKNSLTMNMYKEAATREHSLDVHYMIQKRNKNWLQNSNQTHSRINRWFPKTWTFHSRKKILISSHQMSNSGIDVCVWNGVNGCFSYMKKMNRQIIFGFGLIFMPARKSTEA